MKAPNPFLSFASFGFRLQTTSPLILPAYKGGLFRGALGNNLRKLVCALPRNACQGCILLSTCLYPAIFEPQAPVHYPEAGKYLQAPRPYILNPPLTRKRHFETGEELVFELVLVGRAVDALPYFMVVFSEIGRQGVGRSRGKYLLRLVELLTPEAAIPIYDQQTQTIQSFSPSRGPVSLPGDDSVTTLSLHFLTPLRLKEKGDLVTRFSFPLFFGRLIQRLTILAALYEPNPLLPDFDPLFAQAPAIRALETHLRWYDWERYSRRQEAAMKFGGLVGTVVLSGPLGPFLPYLRLGTIINVGQETTFGLGRFRLEIL